MRWIHCTIIGNVGTTEQVAHTFNFRTNPVADVDQDAAAILTFAGQVRDAWTHFVMDGTSSVRVNQWLSNVLAYTEVRAAYLEQLEPASVTTHQGKTGPVKDFHYDRATYLVPTQYAAFAPSAAIGAGAAGDLPWEVACAVSMKTAQRGPRNRGRFYLGPLDRSLMTTGGRFDAQKTQAIATQFQSLFVTALNTGSGNRLHVVSRAYATSEGINGVRVGTVPDSQRRRRRGQSENYGVVVPT